MSLATPCMCLYDRLSEACVLCRIVAQGYSIVRFPSAIARYHMISHEADRHNPYNVRRYLSVWYYLPRWYEMRCWSGGRRILTELSLCCSIVYYYNVAQRYEQFLQASRLYRALILLGLALFRKSLYLWSSWCYIFNFFGTFFPFTCGAVFLELRGSNFGGGLSDGSLPVGSRGKAPRSWRNTANCTHWKSILCIKSRIKTARQLH